jgi:hypothetical protein
VSAETTGSNANVDAETGEEVSSKDIIKGCKIKGCKVDADTYITVDASA